MLGRAQQKTKMPFFCIMDIQAEHGLNVSRVLTTTQLWDTHKCTLHLLCVCMYTDCAFSRYVLLWIENCWSSLISCKPKCKDLSPGCTHCECKEKEGRPFKTFCYSLICSSLGIRGTFLGRFFSFLLYNKIRLLHCETWKPLSLKAGASLATAVLIPK